MADAADVIPIIREEVRSERLRRLQGGDDFVEALARAFEDPRISDPSFQMSGGVRRSLSAPEARLLSILDATEHNILRGLQTGGAVRGWTDAGFRHEFLDPHPSSNNQVGHFLTAVRLGYDPDSVARTLGPRTALRTGEDSFLDRLRSGIGQIIQRDRLLRNVGPRHVVTPFSNMTNEEAALRLMIGHEKSPDPLPGQPEGFLRQFAAATESDVRSFRQADGALGSAQHVDLDRAMRILRGGITVDETMRGNSYADLALTLVGWHLGRMIRAGSFHTTSELGLWIRTNLADAPAGIAAPTGAGSP